MDFAIIGGDRRFAYLAQRLRAQGCDARTLDGAPGVENPAPRLTWKELDRARSVVMNAPRADDAAILARLQSGARAYFMGPGEPPDVPDGVKAIDLWKDERLVCENAYLTAEGAIAAAMRASERAIHDCECLIVGWGRIGKALTELLVGMNASVTVASRSAQGRNGAIERGARAADTAELEEALPGKQIVFSTPPARVLDEKRLRRLDEDAMVIDLSSAPYGVDVEAARRLGVRAWREPGLPGRYCPWSAAGAILRAIERAEMEE